LRTHQVSEVETTGNAPSARTYHSASLFENFMVIVGGESSSDNNDIYLLDLNTLIWYKPEVINNQLF
jgi:hypothetical protein